MCSCRWATNGTATAQLNDVCSLKAKQVLFILINDKVATEKAVITPIRLIIFFSCGHSFHATCVAPVLDRCFICEQGLLGALTEKATIARNAIFHPDANTDQDDQNDSDSSDDDSDVDEDEMNADEHQTMTAAEAAAEIQNLSQLIANLPPVQLL